MRRYLLFTGSCYYPSGGWNDFYSAHDTIEEAEAIGMKHWNGAYNWWHVIDSTIGEEVKSDGTDDQQL